MRTQNNFDAKTLERMNRIARKSLAYDGQIELSNNAFTFNSTTMKEMSNSRRTLAQANFTEARWTLNEDPSRRSIVPKTTRNESGPIAMNFATEAQSL